MPLRLTAVMLLAAGLLHAADVPKADRDGETTRFQGTWKTAVMVTDGRVIPATSLEKRRTIVKDETYRVVDGDMPLRKGSFKIDPTLNPRQIDLTPDDGPHAGKTIRGIYEFRGGNLRVCFAPPDQDRPTDFSADVGSGRWLVVYQPEAP